MPQLKKGSKQAKDYMSKIRAMKGTKKVGVPALKKSGQPRKTLTKDQRNYNKDVDAYKYFIVYNNKVESGWEYKEDANDELRDNYPKGTAKIMSILQIKRLGIKDPRNDWKYQIAGYSKGSSKFIEYDEKPVKGKTNYRVQRHDTTLLNKGGTFKKFSKIIAGLFDISVLKDIDELKKEYFRLAQIYHPDKGGTTQQFQDLQSEYIKYRNALINGSSLSSEQKTNEMDLDDALMQVVNQISGLVGINIELVGKWIWVSGNTYPIRTELKNAGFLFASTKKMWYYKGTESSGRGNLTMDEIRNKYGSQKIEPKGQNKLSGVGKISTTQKSKLKIALKKVAKALDKRAV